jgi:hypothetical protein
MGLSEMNRRYPRLFGFILALVAVVAGAAAWLGWSQYRAGQVSHAQALASATVLFQAADEAFLITDETGKQRPATVAEVLLFVAKQVAKERVAQAKTQQSAPVQPPVNKQGAAGGG